MTKMKQTHDQIPAFIPDTIGYDDTCPMKKFDLAAISENMSQTDMVCDKFFFKNYVDPWCRQHCNPYSCNTFSNKFVLFNYNWY